MNGEENGEEINGKQSVVITLLATRVVDFFDQLAQ